MSIKRIAVISYHTCPLSDEKDAERGGMNTYVLELSKALSEKGILIDIYTRPEGRNPKIVAVNNNLKVIHVANIPGFIKKRKLTYDLVSSHYYLSGLIGLKIKKELQIPMLITFHTLALMKNLVAREGEKADLQRIKSELLLSQKADKIIATSESDLEYIHTLLGVPLKKIMLLSPGVNLKLFRPIDKQKAKEIIKANLDHKIILYVGRIKPLKGLDVLLYAIKILVHRNPKLRFCLWIVGSTDSDEVIRLNELKRLLKIHPFVKFVGQKSREELPNYYSASEIVVMPSQYESFGLSALEAMACGVPVIITDVTGISSILGKNMSSLLTSASNPILLAKKIKNLLTNQAEHKRMSQEVLKKVQDLSWENVASKFTRITESRSLE